MPAVSAPRIVVMTGTDHHPFDRLVTWVDNWLASHPEAVASCYVQYGTSAARPRCPGSASLQIGQLGDLLDQADVLICHGGPASVSDAWRRGKVPIVVPRTQRLGEHVDDHQVDFCRKFAELGRVRLAEDPAGFARRPRILRRCVPRAIRPTSTSRSSSSASSWPT